MLTRCPACQTVFRVTPEQLAAREGRVRCGHCLNAFNALHNTVESAAEAGAGEPAFDEPPQDVSAPAEAVAFAVAVAEPEAEHAEAAEEPADSPDPTGPADERDADQSVAEPARDLDEAAVGELQAAPATPEQTTAADTTEEAAADREGSERPLTTPISSPGEAAAEARAAGSIRAAGIPVPPPALAVPQKAPADPRRMLGIAVGGLAVTLLVQGIFLLRQPLARAIPPLREPLVALCQRVGCELPLPREAGEISVETSDLHPEPGGRGDFVLHATLRNRARYPQGYPHLELSLTDAQDKTLARRVFSPAEWGPANAPDATFAPGATASVALPFSAAGVAAVGYRVYAFYP